jgi:hypothetical protein
LKKQLDFRQWQQILSSLKDILALLN